ncbi:hypothetical protein DVH24_016113 [Malus domestica]|uniref:Uncharacterized protein n=1 Tax=Malus domestica TaxID=3750 RepID=A0A498JFY2_MALDO|nr:hypothetical protein DVH24_016113 [Malus domestica]
MLNLFGDQSEEEEEEGNSEHESNPQPNSDYNNKVAQLCAGKSSKSNLTIVKFKTPESVDGWEVCQGTYFLDVVASKYDEGMDAKFEFTFTGDAVFSGEGIELSKKLSVPLGRTLDRYAIFAFSNGATKLKVAFQNEIHGIFLIIYYKIWVDGAIWAVESATLKAEMVLELPVYKGLSWQRDHVALGSYFDGPRCWRLSRPSSIYHCAGVDELNDGAKFFHGVGIPGDAKDLLNYIVFNNRC